MYLYYLTIMLSYCLLTLAGVKWVTDIVLVDTKYEIIRLFGDIWALNKKLDELNY